MKKEVLLIGVFCFLFISGTSFAQKGEPERKDGVHNNEWKDLSPEDRAKKKTDKMTEILGLDEDQASRILAINLSMVLEMEIIHDEFKVLRLKKKNLHEKTRLEIEEILNPDQKLIWDQKIEERKQKKLDKKK